MNVRLHRLIMDMTSYSLPHPKHPGYRAHGGYLRDEAIMILRRFYITENTTGEPADEGYAISHRTHASTARATPALLIS